MRILNSQRTEKCLAFVGLRNKSTRMSRVLDKIFFMYFLTHIPITICVDLQAVLPSSLYPSSLIALKDWYCKAYRDSMMMEPPAFFRSFCLCELIFQFPFFFVASYAYYKGASVCTWIRLPVIIYSTHVITTLIAIIFHVLMEDFSKSKYPGPTTLRERLTLLVIYSPYLIVPMTLLADALFSKVFRVTTSRRKAEKLKGQ